jgi:hypothetical protein
MPVKKKAKIGKIPKYDREEHVDGSEVVFLVENEVMEEDCEDCE